MTDMLGRSGLQGSRRPAAQPPSNHVSIFVFISIFSVRAPRCDKICFISLSDGQDRSISAPGAPCPLTRGRLHHPERVPRSFKLPFKSIFLRLLTAPETKKSRSARPALSFIRSPAKSGVYPPAAHPGVGRGRWRRSESRRPGARRPDRSCAGLHCGC